LRYAVAILKKKATKFRNIFFPGREGGARVVAKPVVFATMEDTHLQRFENINALARYHRPETTVIENDDSGAPAFSPRAY
jgi:hypothetical protein